MMRVTLSGWFDMMEVTLIMGVAMDDGDKFV